MNTNNGTIVEILPTHSFTLFIDATQIVNQENETVVQSQSHRTTTTTTTTTDITDLIPVYSCPFLGLLLYFTGMLIYSISLLALTLNLHGPWYILFMCVVGYVSGVVTVSISLKLPMQYKYMQISCFPCYVVLIFFVGMMLCIYAFSFLDKNDITQSTITFPLSLHLIGIFILWVVTAIYYELKRF